MPARRTERHSYNQITARRRHFVHGCLSASANCSRSHQKLAVGEAVSFPYKTVSNLATVAVAVWDEVSA